MISKRVRCPQCGAMAEYKPDNPSRPFCSERCKLIDLGAWAAERYAIPGPPVSTNADGLFPDGNLADPADDGPPPVAANRRLDS